MHCHDCKHWTRREGTTLGECAKIVESPAHPDFMKSIYHYPCNFVSSVTNQVTDESYVTTQQDFGCIHWEAK